MKNLSEQQHVLRKRVYEVRGIDEIRDVVALLRAEKFTGSLSIHVSQGTASAVTLEEKASINPLTT